MTLMDFLLVASALFLAFHLAVFGKTLWRTFAHIWRNARKAR
jgi:hypothetical protein